MNKHIQLIKLREEMYENYDAIRNSEHWIRIYKSNIEDIKKKIKQVESE